MEKKKEIEQGLKDGKYQLIKKKNGNRIVGRLRLIEEDGSKFYTVLKHLNAEGKHNLEDLSLKDDFVFPKPVSLLKELIGGATFLSKNNSDIILDFFAGSGTTAQAVLELNKEDGGNRKFILCEQMKYVEKITVERVKKVIQNLARDKNLFSGKEKTNFIYCELMEYNEQFVEKIKKADTTQKLLNIWKDMKSKSFLNYNVDIKKFDETIDEFKKLSFAKQQRTLFDLLNKNQLYVGLSEIEDVEFGVGEGDKKINEEFYGN